LEPHELEDFKKKMEEKFVCSKCKSKEGKTHEVASTGTGLSKIFDIQYNEFVIIFCLKCGFTESYNTKILIGKEYTMDILDVLFG
jgi:predicted nucleic-acid-binding Zn-ribbon protein